MIKKVVFLITRSFTIVHDRSTLLLEDRISLLLSVTELPRKRHCDTIATIAKLGRLEVHLAIAGDWAKPTPTRSIWELPPTIFPC